MKKTSAISPSLPILRSRSASSGLQRMTSLSSCLTNEVIIDLLQHPTYCPV